MGHRLSRNALKKTDSYDDINEKKRQLLIHYLDNMDKDLNKLSSEIREIRDSKKIVPGFSSKHKDHYVALDDR